MRLHPSTHDVHRSRGKALVPHDTDEVLVGDPLYATYEGVIRSTGADIGYVPLHAEHGFHMRAEDLEAKIKQVADMPVPLATEDADMIRSLIAKVDALDGRLDRFEASMAEAIAKLRG